ncbi:MAG TPA: MotA/TolQ/ExbB proton channel family protein [Bryobacteraceae bacterium]|nr:MotA/TolQ/ExbB proton channel family protein [Bryobacteraceae bacterium]
MATPQAALSRPVTTRSTSARARRQSSGVDISFVAGIVIALGATIAGISATHVGLSYFLQPTGAVIVLGGTLGVILVTTPRHALLHSARRIMNLFSADEVNREELIEEIIILARLARKSGIIGLDSVLQKTDNSFLREALQLAVDGQNRDELQIVLETQLRMNERHGESDAKSLEVAGGFAPTIGIMGTVVGLIEVLRQFSNLQAVGHGIGTAFVSTIYGLVVANLLLLPAAHRIRARVAENFETQELVIEGVLSIIDCLHPSLIRIRLNSFVRRPRANAS